MAEKDKKSENELPQVDLVSPQKGVTLDTSHLKSTYCNVCNATSTREEVVVNFGVNHNWDLNVAEEPRVELHHRIILSPFAAKRFHEMLSKLITAHEARYGELK